MDLRKNIYSLSVTELQHFIEAVNLLKANGTYDTFVRRHHHAMMHATPMPGENPDPIIRNVAHRGPAFLAWHRQELRDYELALQAVKPGVTLPYWDWAQDAQLPDPKTAPLWTNTYIGGDGAGPNDFVPNGPFTHWVALIENTAGDLVPRSTPGIVRRLGRDPEGFATLPTQADVTNCLNEGVYDSAPWGMTSNPSFRNRLEGWLIRSGEPNESRMHNRVHTWVGGDMLPGTSPNDPVFFLHHCNVDRLWAKWQVDKGAPYAPLSGGPVGHNATDPMLYLENPNVTPGSVLDHHAMGYMYDTEGSSIMAWNLVGNANTNPSTDFLGTTDIQPLVVKTNGVERMRISPDGYINWGSKSRLSWDQGGSIELGGDNSTPGAGTPYIDFHFQGLTQDFNTRIINDANGRLSVVANTLGVSGDFSWGNRSFLARDQGGSIELGGDNSTPGTGTPYIDFHFRGRTQDFNTRIINNADGVLSLEAPERVNVFSKALGLAGNLGVGIGAAQPSARLSVIAPGASELSGATRSSTLITSAGSLASASGSELALASIGFHSGNNTSLGIRAVRTANGGGWDTTAIGLGMDVDNTVRAGGASLWLHASGKVGVGGIGASRARLEILDTAPPTSGIGAQAAVFAHSLERHGIYGLTSSKTMATFAAVFGDNEGGGTGVEGVSRGSGVGVRGTSYNGSGVAGNAGGDFGIGVQGVINAGRGIGVLGSNNGRGVIGLNGTTIPSDVGTAIGVGGFSVSGVGAGGRTDSSSYGGVEGFNSNATGTSVIGWTNASGGYGVRGKNTAGGYAAAFEGRVHVAGLITASSKNFKIDHPLDPANKTLQHSSVESPDMLCVYNGNVTTDARGKATVVLPDYFEALNRDFRYQLTTVGQPAQANVEHEIEGNRFTIETDKPNVKVSWQVAGVRHDAYAETYREPVEQDKPEGRRGRYLHSELYGDSDTDTSWFGPIRSMFAEAGSLSEGLPVDDPSDNNADPL